MLPGASDAVASALKHRNAKRGLATLCVSGGLGVALSIVRD